VTATQILVVVVTAIVFVVAGIALRHLARVRRTLPH
jgi:hypothetical protein